MLRIIELLADVESFAVDLDVVELDTVTILKLDIMPINVTDELTLVIVAKRQLRLGELVIALGVHHEEGEQIAGKQILLHHVVEERSRAWFGQLGVSHADNGLEGC